MNSIIQIINGLRRLCLLNSITPENIKITVEFLEIQDSHRAEWALRQQAQGFCYDPRLIDSIVEGRDFRIMGFRFVVKEFVPKTLPGCNCLECRARRG